MFLDATMIGFIAAFLTTIAFLPQAIQTLKTRRTKDISLPMYIALVVGIALWFVYGLILQSMPIILANGISFLLATPILILKIQNG
ncbi:MAG TPA: SemiSWEET transporter [Methylomirabilota bacterium]|nr:SemiSWEET transporter [Methylomirabilota bacterium]